MAHRYRFESSELDSDRGALLLHKGRDVQPVHVPPQPFRALEFLVRRAGRLVSRTQLAGTIWPNEIFVDQELGLNHCIRRLRAALQDDARRPRFIETVPRRGFRFIAPVVADPALAPTAVAPSSAVGDPIDGRLAVSRFADLTPLLEAARFGVGLTEEVLRAAFDSGPPGRQIVIHRRAVEGPLGGTIEPLRPDWILTGSARYGAGELRVVGYLIRARDGLILRTGTWHEAMPDLGLDVQRRVAEALVRDLLAKAPRTAEEKPSPRARRGGGAPPG